MQYLIDESVSSPWAVTNTTRNGRKKIVKIARNRRILWDWMIDHPCMDCGEEDPIVLTFDHRDPSKKLDDVAKIANRGCGVEKLQAEIVKCDVVCHNCHTKRSAIMFGNWRLDYTS